MVNLPSRARELAGIGDDSGNGNRVPNIFGERQDRSYDYLGMFFVEVYARIRDAIGCEIGKSSAEKLGLSTLDAAATIGGSDEQPNRLANL
jgi:hypothetical protein